MLHFTLDLYREGEGIAVEGAARVEGDFAFCLSRDLDIDAITINGKAIEVTQTPFHIQFSSEAMRYTGTGEGELRLRYHGAPPFWHTLYLPDTLAVNYYTGWYPMGDGAAVDEVRVHIGRDFTLINGTWDEDAGLWRYIPFEDGFHDVNILALRGCETKSDGFLSLYYYGKENKDKAEPAFEACVKIRSFYDRLYETKRLQPTSLVILPKGNTNDAYLRTRLVVFGGFVERFDGLLHLLAHELGHSWGCGADTASWEDWLNETVAEWSALLFELDRGNEAALERGIASQRERAKGQPPIRTKDGKNPGNTHDRGVLAFYEIYKTDGAEAIVKMLRVFDHLESKTTEAYLAALKEAGLAKAAATLEAQLTVVT